MITRLYDLLRVYELPARVNWGLFALRVVLAVLMIPHGYSKWNNLMAGEYTDFPDPLHVGPALSLGLTVFAELLCSVLLLVGLGTRLALIPLIICMVVIVFNIHLSDPLGDKEHGLMYLAGYLALYLAGPGAFSLDERLFGKQTA